MKRLLLLISLLALVASASAVSLTFQNPADFTAQITGGKSVGWGFTTPIWVYNQTGGNSAVGTYTAYPYVSWFKNSPPAQATTRASAVVTYVSATGCWPSITLYKSDGSTVLYTATLIFANLSKTALLGRYDVVVDGTGVAHILHNGYEFATSSVLSENPSYVSFGTAVNGQGTAVGWVYWDDFIYGTTAQQFIFDMPQTNYFIIKKDLLNSADRGFAYASNGTVISSHYMWSQYSIPNQLNESIILQNYGDGNTVATFYPGTSMAGEIYWNLDDALFNNPVARYGNYVIRSTNASAILPSDFITYEGYGASCSWNAASYVPLDTGTASWAISSGGYWNTTGYDYKLCIQNPYGAFVQNTSIISQTGSANYQFTTTDPQGIYTAVVMAIPHAGGAEIWMTADYANLFQYVSFVGYVNGAQYAIPIPAGAHYNLTQGAIIQQGDTLADGSYNATGFLTGSNVTINVTAANHRQYYVEIQPLNPRRVELNITLVPINVSEIGSSIGGVLRTGSLNGTIVSKGFGEPITSATVTASNATEVYTNVSNNAAWYLFDNTNAALVSGRLYTINATKAGYGTQSYQVVAP